MRICGIYYIENSVNGKRIVGSSVHITKRWSRHRKDLEKNKHGNPHLQSAWNKYGPSKFSFHIIEACNETDLLTLEDYYISMLNTFDRNWGYNLKLASRPIFSEETMQRIKAAGRARCGEKNSNFGKHFSEEHKRKIAKANTGYVHTEATKYKLSQFHKGRKLSKERVMASVNGHKNRTESQKEETRVKMRLALCGRKQASEAIAAKKLGLHNMSKEAKQERSRKIKESWRIRKQRGEKPWALGRPCAEETKAKIRETKYQKRKILSQVA